jgi:ribonuclease P protein component
MGFGNVTPPPQGAKSFAEDDASAVLASPPSFSVFPRRKRLSRAAFPSALAKGRRISSPHFVAVIPKETSGYAIIVPKKVSRLSVTRHRIKRRVLEALHTLPLPPALILFPKSPVAHMTHKEVVVELIGLLSKIQ